MAFFQVHRQYPGHAEIHADHVMQADNAKQAREYSEHRFSPAYGYDPATGPKVVKVVRVSARRAQELLDDGAIDWAH